MAILSSNEKKKRQATFPLASPSNAPTKASLFTVTVTLTFSSSSSSSSLITDKRAVRPVRLTRTRAKMAVLFLPFLFFSLFSCLRITQSEKKLEYNRQFRLKHQMVRIGFLEGRGGRELTHTQRHNDTT